jgi:hypothetical protein
MNKKWILPVLHITLAVLLILIKPGSGRSDRGDPPEGEDKMGHVSWRQDRTTSTLVVNKINHI